VTHLIQKRARLIIAHRFLKNFWPAARTLYSLPKYPPTSWFAISSIVGNIQHILLDVSDETVASIAGAFRHTLYVVSIRSLPPHFVSHVDTSSRQRWSIGVSPIADFSANSLRMDGSASKAAPLFRFASTATHEI